MIDHVESRPRRRVASPSKQMKTYRTVAATAWLPILWGAVLANVASGAVRAVALVVVGVSVVVQVLAGRRACALAPAATTS